MSDKIKLSKQITVDLEGEAEIDEVEVYYIHYNKDKYPQANKFWESIIDKNYEFQIEGRVDVKLSINDVEYNHDFLRSIDFVVTGDYNQKRLTSKIKSNLQIWPDDVLYEFFTENQLNPFVKDCIMKKINEISSMSLEDIGNPPLDGNDFSLVTSEWISSIE